METYQEQETAQRIKFVHHLHSACNKYEDHDRAVSNQQVNNSILNYSIKQNPLEL